MTSPRAERPGAGPAGDNILSRVVLVIPTTDLSSQAVSPRDAHRRDMLPGPGGLAEDLTIRLQAAARAARNAVGRLGPARDTGRPTSITGPPASDTGWPGRLGIDTPDSPAAGPGCSHPGATRSYRVPRRLRHHLEARDQTCRNPICRRPAEQADIDHTVPWDRGGPTCHCNTGPLCRLHHQVKQLPGWQLTQPEPGIFVWRTPAGLTYTAAPQLYPL